MGDRTCDPGSVVKFKASLCQTGEVKTPIRNIEYDRTNSTKFQLSLSFALKEIISNTDHYSVNLS